jgi:hypothetical protein
MDESICVGMSINGEMINRLRIDRNISGHR